MIKSLFKKFNLLTNALCNDVNIDYEEGSWYVSAHIRDTDHTLKTDAPSIREAVETMYRLLLKSLEFRKDYLNNLWEELK